MKGILTLICLLPLMLSFSSMDLGSPSINAVCGIKLKSGAEAEGMIRIVSGGYQGFRKNGFGYSFAGEQHFQYSLFNVNEFRLEGIPSSYRVNASGVSEYPDLYFLAWQPGADARGENHFDRTTKEVTVSLSVEYKYLAIKSFSIFNVLSVDQYLPFQKDGPSGKQGEIVISVNDIERFDLLVSPGEKWLKLIADTRKARELVDKEWVDYQEPLWYHEIRTDETLFRELSHVLASQSTIFTNGN